MATQGARHRAKRQRYGTGVAALLDPWFPACADGPSGHRRVLGAAPAMGVVHVLLGFHPVGPLRLPSGPDSGVRDVIITISDATTFIIIIMTSCTTRNALRGYHPLGVSIAMLAHPLTHS